MIYVIAIRGDKEKVGHVIKTLRDMKDSYWQMIANDTIMVSLKESAIAVRSFIERYEVEVTVLELSGNWATGGYNEVANWLKGAERKFYEKLLT